MSILLHIFTNLSTVAVFHSGLFVEYEKNVDFLIG